MRVLVAEDEVYLAEAVRAGLRAGGDRRRLVHDGDAALEAITINDYDVLLLDRDLPGTHGDEVCRSVAAGRRGVRVMMLTAAGRPATRVAASSLGADDYLAKPFEFPELVARLRALARRTRQSRPPVPTRGGCDSTRSGGRSSATACT